MQRPFTKGKLAGESAHDIEGGFEEDAQAQQRFRV
jgi:hypothetical protein